MHLHITDDSWSFRVQNPDQFTATSGTLSETLTEIIYEAAAEPRLEQAIDRMILALYRNVVEITNDDILELKHTLQKPDAPFCEATIADVMESALWKLTSPVDPTTSKSAST